MFTPLKFSINIIAVDVVPVDIITCKKTRYLKRRPCVLNMVRFDLNRSAQRVRFGIK